MAFEIVCCLELGDSTICHHLKGIALHPLVSRLWIVRSRRSSYAEITKSEYVLAESGCKPIRWLQMRRHCLRLGQRPEVKAFVSFNPIPYGLIAYQAARRYNKPIHFGFIGSDWYRDVKGKWGPWLLPTLRKGDFFTTTGGQMRTELMEHGFAENKIRVLPHCVDLDHYPVADPGRARYSCVFIGRLIPLKRVDLILHAFAQVVKKHPRARLCIVGEGPLEGELKKLTADLGLVQAVDFTGQVADVQPYLADARMVLIASDREGFPFSLVEGIASGVVPVTTGVGTIPDMLTDGQNCLMFAKDDSRALADCIGKLLDDQAKYELIRKNVIQLRSSFSYDRATEVWDAWLRRQDQ